MAKPKKRTNRRRNQDRGRVTKASGDMIVIRYADDTIVGFQHEHEARAFLISRSECASSNWRCTRTKPG